MNQLNNIAIFLDLTEMDDLMLRYLRNLDRYFSFQSITIVHYVNLDFFPMEVQNLLPQTGKSLDEILREEVQVKLEKEFIRDLERFNIHIYSQTRMEGFVEWLDNQKYDLMILGKKAIFEGTGSFSTKVTRLCNTDVLLIPESTKEKIEKILLPMDFSSYTKKLLEFSQYLANQTKAELIPVHVTKTSTQYFPFISNKPEYEEIHKTKAIQEYKKLQSKSSKLPELIILPRKGYHVSKIIYDYALIESVSMILIGLKGNNDEDDLLIGSVAERLISNEKSIPIMILKK